MRELAAESPPGGIDPADKVDAAVFRVVLEELDQFRSPCSGVQGRSLNPRPHSSTTGLPSLMQIAGIVADFHVVAEELPVVA